MEIKKIKRIIAREGLRMENKIRNSKIIFIAIFFIINLSAICFGYQENLNPEQPISIGEKIYVAQDRIGDTARGIVYIYEGCENNSIKIKIRRDTINIHAITSPTFESLTLPLNSKKQALLKVETLNSTEPKKEILITVVDDFYRIKVEEFKKNGK